jgi:hypothetical protein
MYEVYSCLKLGFYDLCFVTFCSLISFYILWLDAVHTLILLIKPVVQ